MTCETELIVDESRKNQLCIECDLDRLARLLLSVNVKEKNQYRPLTPIQAADEIQAWINEKKLSIPEITEKFALKDSGMIKHFLNLLKLPKSIQQSVGWTSGSIGISTASQIAQLPSQKEMTPLAKALAKDQLDRGEVMNIVSIRKKNPDKSLNDCVKEVKDFRIEWTEENVITGNVQEDNLKFIKNYAKNKNLTADDALKQSIGKEIPLLHIINLKFKPDNTIFLSLDEEGFEIFEELPQKLNFPRVDFFNFFITELGENNES